MIADTFSVESGIIIPSSSQNTNWVKAVCTDIETNVKNNASNKQNNAVEDIDRIIKFLQELRTEKTKGESFPRELDSYMLRYAPNRLKSLLNEKGEVSFNSKYTLICLLFGEEVCKKASDFLVGTLVRLSIFTFFGTTFNTILCFVSWFGGASPTLGYVGCCLQCAWVIVLNFTQYDYRIVKVIMLTQGEVFFLNMGLQIFSCACLWIILNGSFVCIQFIIYIVPIVYSIQLMDAVPSHQRRINAPLGMIAITLMSLVVFLAVNLGWFAGMTDTTQTVMFTLVFFDRTIPYTAYSGFNSAFLPMFFLNLDFTRSLYRFRRTSQLRMHLNLVGVDGYLLTDFQCSIGFFQLLPKVAMLQFQTMLNRKKAITYLHKRTCVQKWPICRLMQREDG